jgi:hypothetical protein
MYRPQFVYLPSPKNTKDVRVSYSFDQSNTPSFGGTIAAGNAYSSPILLPTDQDADFFLRAIQIQSTQLLIGVLDPYNNQLVNPLSPGYPATLLPDLWSSMDGAGVVAMESDNWGIYCPFGSSFTVYVQNATGGALAGPVITFHGIKRYCGEACK